MQYILNFNVSRDYSEVKYEFDEWGVTNLSTLIYDFDQGKTNWSVPKNANIGDIVVFMCAKSARSNIGMATSHIPAESDQEFFEFAFQFCYREQK